VVRLSLSHREKEFPVLLQDLFNALDPAAIPSVSGQAAVSGVCDDSRLVRPGDLFVARAGTQTDGSKFLRDAAQRGAVAAIVAAPVGDVAIPQLVVGDTARAASFLAHVFHNRPSRMVKVVGVTGTNGKTTTTYLVRQLLKSVSSRCGLIGTCEIDDGRTISTATMTTPGAVEIAALLASMRSNRCRACAIEVSSHALHQARVAGVEFAAAAFTNLTRDHLDYHGTMENYADAKASLFTSLDSNAVAVVNGEDPWSERMVRDCRARLIRFGFGSDMDYSARDVMINSRGSNFVLVTPDGRTEVSMSLVGRYNIENALAAAALVGEAFALNVHQIAAGLARASGAPGRLQSVDAGQPFTVLVDYAHSDDALENVLATLRPMTRGALRVVFGCGGDRDRGKRPLMADTACRLADAIYVTNDNPRTEDPEAIIREILCGVPAGAAKRVRVEPDRRSAIRLALSDAAPGDIVLLAGKGHENYQIVGQTKHHFDDREEAQGFLQSRGHRVSA